MNIREKDTTIAGHGSGTPRVTNLETYCSNRYAQKADNGLRKGLVAVRRIRGGMTPGEQRLFHDAYMSILGRNYYSQKLREHVFVPYNGSYYSDCSSSGDACYGRAGHPVGWLNTAGIYQSTDFETVPVIIDKGHVQNPEILQVGDALLFRGNDPSRPLQIGHVEFVYCVDTDPGWHWVQADGGWYYQDRYGHNSHGWKLIQETGGSVKHWYYFNKRGQMLKGTIKLDGETFYLMEDGVLEGACCVTNDRGALVVWNL